MVDGGILLQLGIDTTRPLLGAAALRARSQGGPSSAIHATADDTSESRPSARPGAAQSALAGVVWLCVSRPCSLDVCPSSSLSLPCRSFRN